MFKLTFGTNKSLDVDEVRQTYSMYNAEQGYFWNLIVKIVNATLTRDEYINILTEEGALDLITVENSSGETTTLEGYTKLSFLDMIFTSTGVDIKFTLSTE